MMPTKSVRQLSLLVVSLGLLLSTGCVLAIGGNSDGGTATHVYWAGTYAKKQAAAKDRDRKIALQVRHLLNTDADLKNLSLSVFVKKGEVTLCGTFPSEAIRAKAMAMISQINEVVGVDTDCSPAN